ncbi:MAG TPA: hypothetical protein VIN38_03350 [Thiobacillus sp.]
MKRAWLPLLLVMVLAGIAVSSYWLKRPAVAQAVACPDPLAGCTFNHHGTRIKATFSTQPTPLGAFEVRIHAPDVRTIRAEFQMNGMDMGFNRYDLRSVENNVFAAQVTLPVCVSGRRDWTMTLNVDGSRYALPFSSH